MWRTDVPIITTEIRRIPLIFQDNWKEIDRVIATEHYEMSSALRGKHRPGLIGVIFEGTDEEIQNLTPPQSGCLAFNTTSGQLWYSLNASWVKPASSTYRTSVFASVDTEVLIPPSGASIPFNLVTKDNLNEYSTTTYTFIPKSTGYFMIQYYVCVLGAGGVLTYMQIQHNDANEQQRNLIVSQTPLISGDRTSFTKTVVLQLNAGDRIRLYFSHTYATNIVLEAGNDRSFLNIQRLS